MLVNNVLTPSLHTLSQSLPLSLTPPSHIEVTESSLAAVKEEKESLVSKVGELEGTVKKLNKDLEEEREKETQVGGVDGLSRIEVARVLRERNEFKEKYLSLLEQIR